LRSADSTNDSDQVERSPDPLMGPSDVRRGSHRSIGAGATDATPRPPIPSRGKLPVPPTNVANEAPGIVGARGAVVERRIGGRRVDGEIGPRVVAVASMAAAMCVRRCADDRQREQESRAA
jgi:hypothetical protein